MRTILLFRHAPPEAPDGLRRCLGSRTDLPADAAGLSAAAALTPLLPAWDVRSVWSSPMRRCRQTAAAMAGALPVGIVPELTEQDCGLWDGLRFDEIRRRFPEAYARRGEDPSLPPPGGEAPDALALRGLAALRALASRTEGNLAVVAHAGINRAMLCALQGLPMTALRSLPQPYLCVNILRFGGARFTVAAVGRPAEDLYKDELRDERTV